MDIHEVTPAEFARAVEALPAIYPVMGWGPPGVGKTMTIRKIFEDKGYQVWPILAGCSEPTDFSGIPFKIPETDWVIYAPPEWAYKASKLNPDGPKIVLFFDDLPTGHEQTQAACFKLFHERTIGGTELRDDVRIIAAGNRIEDKSAAQEMPKALCNRMIHFNIRSDPDNWVNWALLSKRINPLVIAYIRMQKQDLNQFAGALENDEKAFATPRSWEMLSITMDKVRHLDEDLKNTIASGIIGAGTASKFLAYVRNSQDLVSPEDIVKDPDFAPIPEGIDALYATITSLETHIIRNPKGCEAGLTYSLRIPREMGVLLSMSITKLILQSEDLDPQIKANTMTSDSFNKVMNNLGPFFTGSKE